MLGKAPTDRSSAEYKAWRKEYDRLRWLNDRAALEAKNRRYYAENAEKVNAQKRSYWRANRGRMAAARRTWAENNRHVIRHHNARRKKLIARATPPWADLNAIKAVYAAAERLTQETGVLHHVDHIVPLQADGVCGLHVHWNLTPLPWVDNVRKKNRFAS
jgi:hypothetical protein